MNRLTVFDPYKFDNYYRGRKEREIRLPHSQFILEITHLYEKLYRLEDIEEEIGIDLIVREKALNDGFYYIDHEGNIIHVMNYISNRSYGFVCAEYDTISYYEVCLGELRKECQFYYTDYGKKQHGGWALTKEELEK